MVPRQLIAYTMIATANDRVLRQIDLRDRHQDYATTWNGLLRGHLTRMEWLLKIIILQTTISDRQARS